MAAAHAGAARTSSFLRLAHIRTNSLLEVLNLTCSLGLIIPYYPLKYNRFDVWSIYCSISLMNEYYAPRGQTPIRFVNRQSGEILEQFNSLPLSSRTPGEVLEDHAVEFSFLVSHNRSITRRKSSRIKSVFVVEYLDMLDDLTKSLGRQVGEVAMAYWQPPKPSGC
jgi:hypothetical protein